MFKPRHTVWIMILLIALVACTSREDRSQEKLSRAVLVEKQHGVDAALPLYEKIVAEYAGSGGAHQAQLRIDKIRTQRALTYQKHAADVMKSIEVVIQGYQSMFGRLPGQAADFDDENFFFDTGYLNGLIPPGFSAQLALDAEYGGYRIWLAPDQEPIGFHVDGTKKGLKMYRKVERAAEVEDEYRLDRKVDRMTFLVPRS